MGSWNSRPETPRPILTDTPWRRFPFNWDYKTVDLLRREVERYKPREELQVTHARLLVLGFIQAGKSSLFNSINSACKDKISLTAMAAPASSSLTKQFRVYGVRSGIGNQLNFELCDTMGAELGQGLHMDDVPSLLDGHIPDRWKFDQARPITSRSEGYISTPSLGQQPHALILVIDSQQVDVMSDGNEEEEGNWSKLRKIREKASERDIVTIVVLTKIDIEPEIAEDIENVYRSIRMRDIVEKVHEKLQIQKAQIMMVKNYVDETHTETKTSILLLDTIRHILNQAEAMLEGRRDLRQHQQQSLAQPE